MEVPKGHVCTIRSGCVRIHRLEGPICGEYVGINHLHRPSCPLNCTKVKELTGHEHSDDCYRKSVHCVWSENT